MKILMLGAGGIGGYLGAKIHHAGGDITFLVRPARADELMAHGLHVTSPLGNLQIAPKLITSAQDYKSKPFDAVILSCKAYDLDTAIEAVAPVLSDDGIIVPLLNGIKHLSQLDKHFGRNRVLGGLAHLGVTKTHEGKIHHLNRLNRFVIGSRTGLPSSNIASLAELLDRCRIDFFLSESIEHEMWDKFIFLTALAGATCTMRASLGDIIQTFWGEQFITGLFDECTATAGKCGHKPSPERLSRYRTQLLAQGSASTASMLRDIEEQGRTEAEHILGDMVHRATTYDIDIPCLKIAYSHLQAYEIRRSREQTQQVDIPSVTQTSPSHSG